MNFMKRALMIGILLSWLGWPTAGIRAAAPADRQPQVPQDLLFDQQSTGEATSFASSTQYQNASFAAQSNQAADDFVLNCAGSCALTQITTRGLWQGGFPDVATSNVLVQFYSDAETGLPATLMDQRVVPATSIGNFSTGDLDIPLDPVTLGPGRWWVSVQAITPASSTSKTWTWREHTLVGSPSAWQNPSGLYRSSCTTWGARVDKCQFPTALSPKDFTFALYGTSSTTSLKPVLRSISPAVLAPGAGTFVLTLKGYNFVPGATVQWNGATTGLGTPVVVSGNVMTVTVDSSLVASLGTVPVNVQNPNPCLNNDCPSDPQYFRVAYPIFFPIVRR